MDNIGDRRRPNSNPLGDIFNLLTNLIKGKNLNAFLISKTTV